MPSILQPDTSFTLPNFTLVTASAGSGKTHTLTLRYLQLLLSPRIPHTSLKNILAITFTNNAASEMKQRILEYLKCASLGIQKPGLQELREVVSLDEESFRARSGECLSDILDNYSDFQVQTIDSFIIRLLKVSAIEFGYTPKFDVSFTLAPLLREALDHVAREITRDKEKLDLMEEVVRLLDENQRMDSRFLWDPFAKLSREFSDVYFRLSSRRGEPEPEDMRGKLILARRQVLERINAIEQTIKKSGFKLTAAYAKIVEAAAAGDIESLVEKSLTQKVILKVSGAAYERAVASIELLQDETGAAMAEYIEAKARAYYQPYLRAYRLLSTIMDSMQRKRGEVQLAGANKSLANHLDGANIPEVYFSLGERIHHYLIDEFQDTSPIQWNALRPLIENTLSQEGSLFLVGDTKQSIYSFRGADWHIMARMKEENEFPSALTDRISLPVNWRSSEAIVRFVNHVFCEIIPATDAASAAQLSGLTSFKQEVPPEAKGTGYVEVSVFEPREGTIEHQPGESPEHKKLISILHDCISRGYSYGDIAILTPKNNQVVEVSRWLNSAGIKFMSHSSLDIRTRKITGEMLSLLKFLDSPVDDLSFAAFLLGELYNNVATEQDSSLNIKSFLWNCRSSSEAGAPLYTLFREQYPDLWKLHFEKLFNLVGYLPIYDLIAEVISTFDVFRHCGREEATIVKMVEVIKTFEDKGSNSIKDFLAYSGEHEDEDVWNIEKSGSVEAVTVMTVHKAKGLGFPVVIALFYDSLSKPDNLAFEENGDTLRLVRTTKAWSEKCDALAPSYRRLTTGKIVDELNKLYVALTRAREEMYVLAVKRKRAHEPSKFLPANGFTIGKPSFNRREKRQEREEAPQLHHPTNGLAQATGATLAGREEIRRGDLIHAALSTISFVDETAGSSLERALSTLAQRNRETIDLPALVQTLLRFLSLDSVKPFFQRAESRTVMTEQEFVGSDGKLRRLDRLIVDPSTITIVDFKTGAERKEYGKQLHEYIQVVQQVYPGRIVQAILAYVDLGIVKRVA